MKNNTINVKLHFDSKQKIKQDVYVDINKADIEKLVIGLSTGMNNGVDYRFYYFTFMMKDGEWINVDLSEGYKFKDLIVKYNLVEQYHKYKNNTQTIELDEEETEK